MTTRGTKFPPEPLTGDEAKALLQGCSKKAATGIRNRALLVVLYRAGLRISEALAVMEKDLDIEKSMIRVLQGKGKKSRVVGLDAGAWAILQVWLAKRAELGLAKRQPVFCTLKGQNIKTAYVRAMLKRLARKAGIEKRVHAHGLRHSHAFELAGEGIPTHAIQQQLGHSNLATTDRYIRHLNPVSVVDVIRQREWSL